MVEVGDEVYLIATEAAKFLNIPRGIFYTNVKPFVPAHKIGARRRKHYKQSDLVKFRIVEMVA